ncbi:MAG: C-GCAxxG-C-C family protein [Saccharofermentans sp.]|nr:C-GCAxxG-C-C family protein [Saccharofermentans sp.]
MENIVNIDTATLSPEEKGELACSLRGKGCNCCQAVIMAYKDELGLSEQDIKKMGAAFGGGMATMDATCGALVGAGIALGMLKYDDSPIRGNAKALISEFKEMSKAASCRDLKGIDTGVMLTSCEDCMKNAVKALSSQF